LLSDQDALSPPVRFYQRLLALDVEEALEVCEDYLKEHPIVALCDNVLVPALRLAQADRHHGTLEESKHELVIQTVRDAFEDLSRQSGVAEAAAAEAAAAEAAASDPEAAKPEAANPAPADEPAAVVCVPAHDMADEVVGMMVVELLSGRGVKAQNLSSTSLSSELVSEAARLSPAVVCVSALPPFSVMHARYLCKRLAPEIGATTTLMAGLWQPAEETARGEQKLAQTGVSSRVSSVSEAVETIAKLVTSTRLLNCA
jgi:methanogenic corrinoid protein MtbC1